MIIHRETVIESHPTCYTKKSNWLSLEGSIDISNKVYSGQQTLANRAFQQFKGSNCVKIKREVIICS